MVAADVGGRGHALASGRLDLEELQRAVAAALLVLYVVGDGMVGWVAAAAVTALVAALCAVETIRTPARP